MWSFTTWFNGSQKLIKIGPGGQISIYSSRQISVVGQDSLRLYEVHRFDHGNYSCRALYVFNDNMSITTEDIKLLVKGETQKLYHFTVAKVPGQSLGSPAKVPYKTCQIIYIHKYMVHTLFQPLRLLRRRIMSLSRTLPTPPVFISGYAYTVKRFSIAFVK